MASSVHVCETFVSIQGESTYSGLTCYFARLSGCNLRCKYCDTPENRKGRTIPVASVVEECVKSNTAISEITGGEPLLQPAFPELAKELRDATRRPVLVETNGSLDISLIPEGVTAVMDVKTPGSGVSASIDLANIGRLRPYDEVKFVVADRRDYLWAAEFVRKHRLATLCRAVLFSPVFGVLDGALLAGWVVQNRLPVRVQLQMHKILGVP